MGEPVRIDDVARKLIEQSGKDIEIVYTGLREGEKIDEVLIAHGEEDRRPVHELITHVDVPPLGGYDVLGTSLELDADLAKKQLRVWCEVGALHNTHVA
jgi:FlaA1/EpsC-like NDP-sugar epimerase